MSFPSFFGFFEDKEKQRIFPANLGKGQVYDIELSCSNCSKEYVFAIPKRLAVEEFIKTTACPNCECKKLRKGISDTYY
jgi:hypothetical protein